MTKIMFSEAEGALRDLNQKLGSDNGSEVLQELKLFLRRENPFEARTTVEPKIENEQVMLNTAKGETLMLSPDDISFFAYEDKQRYWIAFLGNGKKYALKRSTKSDKLLGFSATFFRPDKSYIINIRLLAFIKDGICVMKPPYEMVDDIKIGNDKLTELRKIYPNI